MKVSIIIPVYNVAPYIGACLQSVFSQTYKDIEVIIVDDCGTDNSIKIVQTIISNYQGKFKTNIIHHSHNRGLSAARNTGIQKATGEYIYFLDSDDILPSNSIKSLINKIQPDSYADFVIGGMETFGYKKYTYPLLSREYLTSNKDIFIDFLLFRWNVMACNKLINTSFIRKHNIKFLEGYYHEDMDFSFKLALYAQNMACCHDITYYYLIRDNSITTYKQKKNYTDFIKITNNNFLLLEKRCNVNTLPYISEYVTESLYRIFIEIIKERNPQIKLRDKFNLLNQIKQINKTYCHFNKRTLPYKIKYLILESPIIMTYPILRYYLIAKTKK